MKRRMFVPLLVGLILMLPAQAYAKDHPHPETDAQPVSMQPADTGASKGKAHQKEDPAEPGPTVEQHPAQDDTREKDDAEQQPPTQDPGDPEPPLGEPPTAPQGPVGSPVCGPPEPSGTTTLCVALHPPHEGANSASFGSEDGCGGIDAAVVWHFVLNGLDPHTTPASLTVRFRDGGTIMVFGRPVGDGSTQHFYVGTGAGDVLIGATAEVGSRSAGKLVLSHVSVGSTGDQPDAGDEPGDTVDDDGRDDDTDDRADDPADDGDDDGDHGVIEPDEPQIPDPREPEPFLGFEDTAHGMDGAWVREDYLPYTGDPGVLILGFASLSAAAGGASKRKSRVYARRAR